MSGANDLAPVGPELASRNRRILAERLRWPAGALEACEAIAADWPRWNAYYSHGVGQDPGYYATHNDHYHLEPAMYGVDPAALVEAIAAHSKTCAKLQPVPPPSWL